MIYELRTYTSTPDRIDDLHARFQEHTLPLFERHGIDVVAFFTEAQDPTKIVYLTRFADEDASASAWAAFNSDEDWLAVKAKSEEAGPLIVDKSSTVLVPSPYSPMR